MHHEPAPSGPHADRTADRVGDVTRSAQTAEDAVRQLARLTIERPSMTPADIDVVLAHLAESVAALPQVTAQLGDILDRTRLTHDLTMDAMSRTDDPDIALDTARTHLDAAHVLAVTLYGRLNAARQETAHVSATPRSEPEDADLPVTSTPDRRNNVHPLPGPSGSTRRGPTR